jgi:flavin-dependent dehydrogenase
LVIGSGATGLPAAIVARETGASVILVEAQSHIGGHAICSGGNISLGGGNSYQKKYGVEDSPELLFRDLIDWSVIEPNGAPPTATTTTRSSAPSRTTVPQRSIFCSRTA